MNAVVAAGLAALAGCDTPCIPGAIAGFDALPHRLQDLGVYKGIRFVNDSIATVPEATMAALKAFPDTGVLILGGYDRGIGFKELYRELSRLQPGLIILMGPAGRRMERELGDAEASGLRLLRASDMAEAVALCFRHARQGSTCLLSPASASYDAYGGFEERGADFAAEVRRQGGTESS